MNEQIAPIEATRREFVEHDRQLFDYIVAVVAARQWQRAGDQIGRLPTGREAASWCWQESESWSAKRDKYLRAPREET